MRALLLASLLLLGCQATPTFATNIALIVDPDNDPLADGVVIAVRVVMQDGGTIEDSQPLSGGELRLEGLNPDDVQRVEVEIRDADGAVVGLGRSQAFHLGDDGLQAAIFVGRADAISRVPRSLSEARTWARGAWVPGGRIVVVGGGDGGTQTVGPVEFIGWDPTRPTEGLGGADLPRIGHGVVLVPEGAGAWGGQVAVIGGTFGAGSDTLDGGWTNAVASVSLVDPQTGALQRDAAPLAEGYMDFRALPTPEGLVALLGGYKLTGDSSVRYTDRIVLLDPAAGEELPGPALPAGTNREQHAAVAFSAQGSDFILVTGGYVEATGYLTRDLLWSGRAAGDPVAIPRSDAPERARQQATDLGTGQVLITGGAAGMTGVADDGEPLDTAEIFDPAVDGGTFEPLLSTLSEPRQRHVAFRIPGGRVLVCGGQGRGGSPVTSCDVFSLDTRRFTLFASSVSPGGPGMTAIPAPDGRVFLVGGATDLGPSDALHVYTPPRWQDE